MEQMEHLKNALGESLESPHWRSYLDAEATTARRALLLLQVRNKYFAEALSTLELMRLKGDDEGVELFRQLSELVSAEKASAEPYGAAGRVGENGSWSIALFRRSFYFDDLLGSVEELKLRCQPGLVFFAFDPETRYEVSDSARECRLEVIGAPGTTFTLVQQ
jgi:hypothetical protein